MSAWGGLILIATGVALGYPTGWIRAELDMRKTLRRERFRVERLILACERMESDQAKRDEERDRLEAENAELRDFLEWERAS